MDSFSSLEQLIRAERAIYNLLPWRARTIFNQVSVIDPDSYQLMPSAKMLGHPKIRILTSRLYISRA